MHRPFVVEKYAPDAIIGAVGRGKANKAMGAAKWALLVASVGCDVVWILDGGGDWKMKAFGCACGVLLVNTRAYVNAYCCLVLGVSYEVCVTIFQWKISRSRMTDRGVHEVPLL